MNFSLLICDNPELMKGFSQTPSELELLCYPFQFKRNHWIALHSGIMAGRIGAAVSLADPTRGYIGFYRNQMNGTDRSQLANQLLDTAENWLRKNGVHQIYGPVDYSTWFNYRFQSKIQIFNSSVDHQFDWEPKYDPLSLQDWFQKGYQEVEKYHSKAHTGIEQVLKLTEPNSSRLISEGYSFKPIDFKLHKEASKKTIDQINRNSFTGQFLFEPLDPVAYETLYAKPFVEWLSELSFFILNSEGRAIGYSFSFIDHGYLVWKTMAIEKEYQGKSLATLVIHRTIQLAIQQGITNMVAALMKSGGQSELLLNRISKPLWTHEYTLLIKKL